MTPVMSDERTSPESVPMSESGSPVPAANQPTHADAPGSGAPTDHDGRDDESGTSGATEGRGPQGGLAAPETDVNPSPGDSAGVSVASADSSLGTSEAGRPVQSTGEMVGPDGHLFRVDIGEHYVTVRGAGDVFAPSQFHIKVSANDTVTAIFRTPEVMQEEAAATAPRVPAPPDSTQTP